MQTNYLFLLFFYLISTLNIMSQKDVNKVDIKNILTEISKAPSAQRIEKDIRTLADFGTRHTLSDTVSHVRGIGAARRS